MILEVCKRNLQAISTEIVLNLKKYRSRRTHMPGHTVADVCLLTGFPNGMIIPISKVLGENNNLTVQ